MFTHPRYWQCLTSATPRQPRMSEGHTDTRRENIFFGGGGVEYFTTSRLVVSPVRLSSFPGCYKSHLEQFTHKQQHRLYKPCATDWNPLLPAILLDPHSATATHRRLSSNVLLFSNLSLLGCIECMSCWLDADVPVCPSRSFTWLWCEKVAECTEVLFGVKTFGCPRNIFSSGSQSPMARG